MKLFVKIYSTLLLLLLLLPACPTLDYYYARNLKVINKSKQVIYVQQSCQNNIDCDNKMSEYVYTNINGQNTKIHSPYRIEPDSIGYLGSTNKHKVRCQGDKLYLFVINEKTLQSRNWKEICEKKLYDFKIGFNQEQLDSLKWEIVYDNR